MEKKPHADHKYIEALLHNDARLLRELYAKFSGKVVNYISKNSGSYDDAQDVIQEVLIVIYHQAKEKDLILTCPFDAYFFLLCKRNWLNKLNKKGIKEVTILDEVVSISDEQNDLAEQTDIQEKRASLFERQLQLLGGKCKELLDMTFKIRSMEEVAKKLGVSYGYARKKKSECLGKLTKMVKDSPEYNALTTIEIARWKLII